MLFKKAPFKTLKDPVHSRIQISNDNNKHNNLQNYKDKM